MALKLLAANRRDGLGPSRRTFLAGGGAGAVALNLGWLGAGQQVGASELAAPSSPPIRSCIFIFYYGGPSHLDMWDMKSHAPREIRGEFEPIATTAPGIEVCQHLPNLARVMHRATLVRSLHHSMRLHDAACVETLTGRPPARGDGENFTPPDETQLFPCLGANVNYASPRGSQMPVVHAALPFAIRNVVPVPCQGGGFLGSAFHPFQVEGDASTLRYSANTLNLPDGLSAGRLQERYRLLRQLDDVAAAASNASGALRAFYDRAFDLLSSERLRQALDITREDDATRDRFGLSAAREPASGGNGAENAIGRELRGQNLLLARRLVEAGVPFINVYDFKQQGQNWDAHSKCFQQHRDFLLPALDRGLSALIEDLHERGLLETTLVVAVGEFGRTPRINADAGRDHWPDCYTALLAGGGVKQGFVYGSSDKIGAYPETDPVTPADLAATIYSRFGIEPATELHDIGGRPFRLTEGRVIDGVLAG